MPESVRNGLEEISGDEYLSRYPIFWQWFLYIFGGFILLDFKEQEYELLSKKTGIPVANIDRAFEIYDLLFPIENGWFDTVPNTSIKALKLFSVPFMGIGKNYRSMNLTPNGEFHELKTEINHPFTYKDLAKWKNLTIELIKIKMHWSEKNKIKIYSATAFHLLPCCCL